MRRLLLFAITFTLVLTVSPVQAGHGGVSYADAGGTNRVYVTLVQASHRGVLYVDAGGSCKGNTPCFLHPQDAVNAAAAGETIRVYPGTYGSRYLACPPGKTCTPCSDYYAPALIVYKNGLTIEAVDPHPANTVIETDYTCWSNAGTVRASTANNVNPVWGSAPNAISIIASGVVVQGFTVLRPYRPEAGGHSTILIGGLYEGYGSHGESLGFGGNTVTDCVLGGGPQQNRNGVTVWHSAGNTITRNTIIDPQWSAISIYDGSWDAEVGLLPPSTGNQVTRNTITDNSATWSLGQAVFVGVYNVLGPAGARTDNTGTLVERNDCGGMGLYTAYSSGSKIFSKNTNVGWTGYFNATDFSFDGNKPPKSFVPSGMSKLQVGPPH